MNQIDETRPGAGREIERTWQRLRAQDAALDLPDLERDGHGTNDIEDEANDLDRIIRNDDLAVPGLLDDPPMDDGDLAPHDGRVPTEEPEYGDHRDAGIRQDDEMVDSDLPSSSDTTI